MTIQEARKVISVMMVAYSNYKPPDSELAAKVWAGTTKEYSYKQISIAMEEYMRSDTSGFAPSPGQIIEKINQIYEPEQMNEQEAWSLVYKAICNSGYESVEEFAKLPEAIQRAVGSPRQLKLWALDENANMSVIQSNFERTYRSELAKQKEYSKMPDDLKRLVNEVNKNSEKQKMIDKQSELIKQIAEEKSGQRLIPEDKETGISSETQEKLEILRKQLKSIS